MISLNVHRIQGKKYFVSRLGWDVAQHSQIAEYELIRRRGLRCLKTPRSSCSPRMDGLAGAHLSVRGEHLMRHIGSLTPTPPVTKRMARALAAETLVRQRPFTA